MSSMESKSEDLCRIFTKFYGKSMEPKSGFKKTFKVYEEVFDRSKFRLCRWKRKSICAKSWTRPLASIGLKKWSLFEVRLIGFLTPFESCDAPRSPNIWTVLCLYRGVCLFCRILVGNFQHSGRLFVCQRLSEKSHENGLTKYQLAKTLFWSDQLLRKSLKLIKNNLVSSFYICTNFLLLFLHSQ